MCWYSLHQDLRASVNFQQRTACIEGLSGQILTDVSRSPTVLTDVAYPKLSTSRRSRSAVVEEVEGMVWWLGGGGMVVGGGAVRQVFDQG